MVLVPPLAGEKAFLFLGELFFLLYKKKLTTKLEVIPFGNCHGSTEARNGNIFFAGKTERRFTISDFSPFRLTRYFNFAEGKTILCLRAFVAKKLPLNFQVLFAINSAAGINYILNSPFFIYPYKLK